MALMAYTQDELRAELRKLGKRDHEMARLLHPEREPLEHHPNIRIGYFGLADWLDDQPEPEQRPFRAALAKYVLAQSVYRRRTLAQFKALAGHGVSKAVLAEVDAARDRKLTVMPYRPKNDNDVNADSEAQRDRPSTWLGFPVRDTDGSVIRGIGRGTGEGSSVTIDYSPEMWGRDGTAHFSGPASDADDVLCHELVHAGRQMNGKEHSKALNGHYNNEEEARQPQVDQDMGRGQDRGETPRRSAPSGTLSPESAGSVASAQGAVGKDPQPAAQAVARAGQAQEAGLQSAARLGAASQGRPD
jgi:hypothetical protein